MLSTISHQLPTPAHYDGPERNGLGADDLFDGITVH